VRPDDAQALSPTYRFEIPRDDGFALPGRLLRLATGVKLGTQHRVTVHDARNDPEGNRSLRSIVKVIAPDLCVLWLHPATLEDGLEAARAVRQAGGSVIVGTGPLVDLWPDGACRIPELDGLLPGQSAAGLGSALAVLASGGTGQAFIEGLSQQPGSGLCREPLERKLLDYAVYSCSADSLWPPLRSDAVGRLRRLALPKAAARPRPPISLVLLHDESSEPVDPDDIIADIASCALLGIRQLDLAAAPEGPALDAPWFASLFSRLARYRAEAPFSFQLRVPLSPPLLQEMGFERLHAAGVESVDLGTVNGGDPEALTAAIRAAESCKEAGIFPTGVLLLGCVGYDLEEDRQGVARAIRAAFPSTAGVDVRIGSVDTARWADWLDAPGMDFHPPGLERERLVLADRARQALQSAWARRSGIRGSLEQFLSR